jgi:Lon protease-like protein
VLQVSARGERRFRILERRVQADGLSVGKIALVADEADHPVPADLASAVKLLERVIEQHPELLERPHRLDSCAWVSARLAELLPLPLEAKQALLEMDDGKARLQRLSALVRPD